MRISPPGSLSLSYDDLLEDVRARLAERAPGLAEQLDESHPAWILLQEAAWMVVTLSGQLDQYPYSVVRQFAHLLGAELQPALPAMGVVVAAVNNPGTLQLGAEPSRWRFFTPQSEVHGLVEFALAEDGVYVQPGAVTGTTQLIDGELFLAGHSSETQSSWVTLAHRSNAFEHESVRFSILATDPERVQKDVTAACARLLEDRQIGWLRFDVAQVGDVVRLDAHIDPAAAFKKAIPGLTPGGDVSGQWGTLDDTLWTPPVRLADNPMLPPVLRGSRPLPGTERDEIVLPNLPANLHAEDLLAREARPAPSEVIRAIWDTLTHIDTGLAQLHPTLTRRVEPGEEEPEWVAGAISRDAWFKLADRANQTFAHLTLSAIEQRPRQIRAGWILDAGATPPRMRAFAIHPELGMVAEELSIRVAWSLPVPHPDGTGTADVVALDIDAPDWTAEILLTVDGAARGVMLNPLLVVNAPAVRDGRTITVERTVPEPINLIHKDIVSPEVIERLLAQGVPAAAAKRLRDLPLARLDVEGQAPVEDFRGIGCDSTEGLLVLNAPDSSGRCRRLIRGTKAELSWYRRTDAELGNVAPGAISLVEQAPSIQPRLVSVTNPVATTWGTAREDEIDAVRRMFGPLTGVPVTPGDWERLVRNALGTRAAGWLVRVWSHAERALVHTALWPPFDLVEADPERMRVTELLDVAGPEVLLVCLGPEDGVLSPEDLDWSQRVVDRLVAQWHQRIPTVERAIVTRLWPLVLQTSSDHELPLPAHTMYALSGTLVDPDGRRAPPPRASLLLNGAVVSVERS